MNIFKEVRTELGLSVREMGAKMEMDHGNYSKLEKVKGLSRGVLFYRKLLAVSGWSKRKFADRLLHYILS